MRQQTSRILILDDEEAVRRVLKTALERRGFELDVVGSAPEARTLLSNARYDLVICDIQMPGLNGVDFYQELEGNHPALVERVIFMTGDLVHSDIQLFLDKIHAKVLRKPFDLAGLYEKVDAVLGQDGP